MPSADDARESDASARVGRAGNVADRSGRLRLVKPEGPPRVAASAGRAPDGLRPARDDTDGARGRDPVCELPADDVAAYVSDMCRDLSGLARGADLGFLAFLLEVAREEADVRLLETTRLGQPEGAGR